MKNMKIMLDGLNCAHCASKIEAKIQKLDNVDNATLNFIGKYIYIEHISENNLILNDVKKIIKSIEPGVKVLDLNMNNNNEELSTDSHSHSHSHECQCSHDCQDSHECQCSHDSVDSHNHSHAHDSVDSHSHLHGHVHSHIHEIDDSKKTIIRIIVASIIFVLSLIIKSEIIVKFNEIVVISFFFAAYLIIGYDILLRAFNNIIHGQIFDENFLMAVASVGAFLIGEYPEAVGVMLFYQIGEYFQSMAVDKSRKQIANLLNIKPDFANLKVDGEIRKVKPENVKIGDYIVVKPGEKIPLDGKIIEGFSSVDTSALTGESIPEDKSEGDEVLSGSINISGVITVEVQKEFGESTVSRILNLVEKASNKKASAENFITKFAKYYTPAVVVVAILISVFPPIFLNEEFGEWIYKGLVFLVVSCPCALVLSIPLTYFGGIGAASKHGILVKGGNYLEALSNVEVAIFDKTGTLTQGKFEVSDVHIDDQFALNMNENEFLNLVVHGEYYSNHPIANSIKQYYGEKYHAGKMEIERIKNYEEIAGHGIKANVFDKEIILGNLKLMNENKIEFELPKDLIGTILFVAIENKFAGYIVISDSVKQNAEVLAEKLKSIGVRKTIMLTGDNRKIAEQVKKILGFDEVYSELLPENKVEKIEEVIQNYNKGKTIFVGDGINDAPVLMRADVGFAMGGVGSDAAVEAADVVIMNDEPIKVYESIEIAKQTKRIVLENILFSLGVKLVVMILTVYGNVSMPLAVFADVGVAIIAVLNASRILKFKAR